MRLALAAQVELTGCLRFDMTRMLYRAARTSQKIGASKPLEFRTFSKAARSKTMRGDTKVLFNTTFTGHKCYNCYKKPNRSKQSTGPGGKCKGSLGSRAEVSSSSFSCPRERLWDWNIMHYIYIYTYDSQLNASNAPFLFAMGRMRNLCAQWVYRAANECHKWYLPFQR